MNVDACRHKSIKNGFTTAIPHIIRRYRSCHCASTWQQGSLCSPVCPLCGPVCSPVCNPVCSPVCNLLQPRYATSKNAFSLCQKHLCQEVCQFLCVQGIKNEHWQGTTNAANHLTKNWSYKEGHRLSYPKSAGWTDLWASMLSGAGTNSTRVTSVQSERNYGISYSLPLLP